MMRKQRDQDNEWYGQAYKIEQDRTHGAPPFPVSLNGFYVIALSAADRRGITCAESAHQESWK